VAVLIFAKKDYTSEGDIYEAIIWKVDINEDFPYGIKYRLVYIHNRIRVLGYDNEKGKGDHKHYLGREEKYIFVDVGALLSDFHKDIEKIRKGLYENQKD